VFNVHLTIDGIQLEEMYRKKFKKKNSTMIVSTR